MVVVTAGTIRPAAALLRRAADGYRRGEITWGRGDFIGDDGCRCLAAAVTWAADPAHPDGDPRFVYGPERGPVLMAMAAVVEHLTCGLGWPWAMSDGDFDLIETVSEWNDAADRDEVQVIALCETVAEGLVPAAVTS